MEQYAHGCSLYLCWLVFGHLRVAKIILRVHKRDSFSDYYKKTGDFCESIKRELFGQVSRGCCFEC